MKPKLMIVNVHFSPISFGGATIVAEELAKKLTENWEILVFTSITDSNYPEGFIYRYKISGIDVVAINLRKPSLVQSNFFNVLVGIVFSDWLEIYGPDIVHFHCIQNMGAEMLMACSIKKIPFIVTIHDCWWICPRQFMINNFDLYCRQDVINLETCKKCTSNIFNHIGDYGGVVYRSRYLTERLSDSSFLLFPSAFHRQLHRNNLKYPPERMLVNKNGVNGPECWNSNPAKTNFVRFGFVGGKGPIKGLNLIIQAFHEIQSSSYEIVLVDNTLNLGYSSIEVKEEGFKGKVTILPAYLQSEIDEFFSRIDVLLFPSQWKESFGLTVREALLRDKWVIATDGGGAVEDIVEGENGTIIPIYEGYRPLVSAIEKTLNIDFSRHYNPYKSKIATFDQQADELHGILTQVLTAPFST